MDHGFVRALAFARTMWWADLPLPSKHSKTHALRGQPQWYRHIALYTKLHVSNSKGKRQPVYQVSFQSKHNK
jgi:hypothetical protein